MPQPVWGRGGVGGCSHYMSRILYVFDFGQIFTYFFVVSIVLARDDLLSRSPRASQSPLVIRPPYCATTVNPHSVGLLRHEEDVRSGGKKDGQSSTWWSSRLPREKMFVE